MKPRSDWGYEIKALAEPRSAEILIYGDVGGWDDESVTAANFVKDIAGVDADYLTLRINSYGGSVSDGLAIFNAIRRHPAAVVAEIDGVAASIASLIAMAADTVRMPQNALAMVHAPWALSMGNATDMREMADVLDRYAKAMTSAYAPRLGEETARAWLTDGQDHWLTADEALAVGFADEITSPLKIAASVPECYRPAAAAAPKEEATMPTEDQAAPTQAAPNVTEIRASVAQEIQAQLRERATAIRGRFDALAKANPGAVDSLRAVYDAAIADTDISVDAFTDRALAALIPQEPVAGAAHTRVELQADETEKRRGAAVESILARAAVPGADGKPRATAGNPYRGSSLMDLARDSLIRAGIKTDGLTKMELVAAAFTQTSSDFPVLLENTMHKALQSSYAIAADTWRRFCAVGSVSDFRAHNRYQIGSLGDLVPVSEAGEFTNKPIPDGRKQSVIVGTYGDIINLTRQAVINDDLGAFVGLAQARGRAAARTIENRVYAVLGLNSGKGPALSDALPIIDAGHGNISAVSDKPTVLSIEAGILKMSAQNDVSGNDYLDLRPSILLIPQTLEMSARVLNSASYDPAATLSTKNQMTPNPYQGLFSDIIATPRLAGTAWYMLADPSIAPVLEVSFLDGVQEPVMEMEQGFTVDGARWKTRLDFGVSGVGYEGIVMNAGA
jgi:ATP-dependent protease ClpP protease subunit